MKVCFSEPEISKKNTRRGRVFFSFSSAPCSWPWASVAWLCSFMGLIVGNETGDLVV
jgi:hypothetical protein